MINDIIFPIVVGLGLGSCAGVVIGCFLSHSVCQGYFSEHKERFIEKIDRLSGDLHRVIVTHNLYLYDKDTIEIRLCQLEGDLKHISKNVDNCKDSK